MKKIILVITFTLAIAVFHVNTYNSSVYAACNSCSESYSEACGNGGTHSCSKNGCRQPDGSCSWGPGSSCGVCTAPNAPQNTPVPTTPPSNSCKSCTASYPEACGVAGTRICHAIGCTLANNSCSWGAGSSCSGCVEPGQVGGASPTPVPNQVSCDATGGTNAGWCDRSAAPGQGAGHCNVKCNADWSYSSSWPNVECQTVTCSCGNSATCCRPKAGGPPPPPPTATPVPAAGKCRVNVCHYDCNNPSCTSEEYDKDGAGNCTRSNQCTAPEQCRTTCGQPPPQTPTSTPAPTKIPCGVSCSNSLLCDLSCPMCGKSPGSTQSVCMPSSQCLQQATISNVNPGPNETVRVQMTIKNPTNNLSTLAIYNMDNVDAINHVPNPAHIEDNDTDSLVTNTSNNPPYSYFNHATTVSPDWTTYTWDIKTSDLYKPDTNYANYPLMKVQMLGFMGGMTLPDGKCVVQLALNVPTPTPIHCGSSCSPSGPGNNPTCDVSCPVCVPNGNGGGTCTVGPTPTPISCGQSCSPSGPGNNPTCNVSCPVCAPNGNGGGTCSVGPTPTPVGCNQSCSNPTQCNINCPVCSPNPNGSGSVCKSGCGQSCSPGNGSTNPTCDFSCPLCVPNGNGGGTCAALPTPTPIHCGQSCSPSGPGTNPKCDVSCPICTPDGNGGGTCVAPTPTPIPCGSSCSPTGPGNNPTCNVTCPVCVKGPDGTGTCIRPTPMPTPICGI